MFKHIIFDCDGVLVDSEPLSMEIDRDILAENGIVMTVAEVGSQFIGLTFEAFVDKDRKRLPHQAALRCDRGQEPPPPRPL